VINVFISRPNWLPPGLKANFQELYETLDKLSLNPMTVGQNVVPLRSPFDEALAVMKQCNCAVILGTHQIIADDVWIKGVSKGRMILPTEWNQVEATMSIMLGLPTLVLLQIPLTARGIFERGAANLFVHPFDARAKGWARKLEPAFEKLKSEVAR
jgi:hypothetical protein